MTNEWAISAATDMFSVLQDAMGIWRHWQIWSKARIEHSFFFFRPHKGVGLQWALLHQIYTSSFPYTPFYIHMWFAYQAIGNVCGKMIMPFCCDKNLLLNYFSSQTALLSLQRQNNCNTQCFTGFHSRMEGRFRKYRLHLKIDYYFFCLASLFLLLKASVQF